MRALNVSRLPKSHQTAADGLGPAIGVCLLIATLVWTVFGQTLGHDFVNLDDNENVYENPIVSQGLSFQAVYWAFTNTQVSRWVPLSTLAHMFDSEVYGMWAGGHHLTCVALHMLTAMALFLMLRDATQAFWRSAFVAVLFAIHPLRVEAVAWVSALQYTLSGLFFVLTLWAYVRYGRRPSTRGYAVVATLFTLGLLSKEMLVTLPAVLLLLDYWPLGRTSSPQAAGESTARVDTSILGKLCREKLPLLALSAIFSIITVLALRSFSQPVATYAWHERIGNALVSYTAYLGNLFNPAGLTPWYPHPGSSLTFAEVALSTIVLSGISGWVWIARRTRPYLIVGWLWFLGMLIPVIGLIQRGEQARSDRYTYLAQIGLYIMIAWGAKELAARWHRPRLTLGIAGSAFILAMTAIAYNQTSMWRDSETLWRHTLAHTSRNYVAHNNLAVLIAQGGRVPEALTHFEQALRIRPTSAEAQNNYGYALTDLGRVGEALPFYENALQLKPDFVNAHLNLADALTTLGRPGEAQRHYAAAERIMKGGQTESPTPKPSLSR